MNIDVFSTTLKSYCSGILAMLSSLIFPIRDFVIVIMLFATINIVLGALADETWSFKKAFRAFIYLGGYLLILIFSVIAGKLMHIDYDDMVVFTSWVTWVMIYFYAVNIFRNWNIRQPENKVIAFIYWFLSFKAIDKIKYLKEFKDYENGNKEK
jgi:hypothetical protein